MVRARFWCFEKPWKRLVATTFFGGLFNSFASFFSGLFNGFASFFSCFLCFLNGIFGGTFGRCFAAAEH